MVAWSDQRSHPSSSIEMGVLSIGMGPQTPKRHVDMSQLKTALQPLYFKLVLTWSCEGVKICRSIPFKSLCKVDALWALLIDDAKVSNKTKLTQQLIAILSLIVIIFKLIPLDELLEIYLINMLFLYFVFPRRDRHRQVDPHGHLVQHPLWFLPQHPRVTRGQTQVSHLW